MTVDILVTGSVVFTGEKVIRDGYVYIKGGRILAVGEEPVPEEYTYATLLLGGRGRIVVPGLAAYADAAAYVIRGFRPRLLHRARFYNALDLDALARISLPAVYEMHLSGVTTIVVEGPRGLDATLAATIGGFYYVAIPACIEKAAVSVWGEGCGAGGLIRVEADRAEADGKPVLSLISRVTYAPIGLRDALALSDNLRKALNIPGGRLAEGERAEVVVFNAMEPPGLLLDLYEGIDYGKVVYSIGAKAESVVIGDDVVVDGGGHLRIVPKHFTDVRNVAEKILQGSRGPGQ